MSNSEICAMAFVLATLPLAACNNSSPCADTAVLAKVKELHDKQEFGEFTAIPPKVFAVQPGSATSVSIDKESGKNRCSVLITADGIEVMRFTQQATEEELARMKEEAPKRGLSLNKDYLIHYIVQPLASGQNYVTLLR